jgi:hypothetical protein
MDRPKCGEPVPSRNVPATRTSYLRVILPPPAAEPARGEAPTVRQPKPIPETDCELTSQIRLTSGRSSVPDSDAAAGRYSQRAPDNGVTVVSGLARQQSAAPPRPSWPPAPPSSPAGAQNDYVHQAGQHFCVAELLFARGHVSDAVLEAQKAMRLCEPSPEQRALYAWLLYKRSGNASQSVWDHLTRALAEDPQCERALQYRALLSDPPR